MNLDSLCIVLVVIGLIIAAVIAGYSAFLPPPDEDHNEHKSYD